MLQPSIVPNAGMPHLHQPATLKYMNKSVQKIPSYIVLIYLACIAKSVYAIDLNEAYQLGLKNDYQFASAMANHKVLLERIPQAASALKPTLNWTAGLTGNFSQSSGTINANDASALTRINQTNTQTSSISNTATTTNYGANDILTSDKTDSTTTTIIKDSSSINSVNDALTDQLKKIRGRSLASALVFSMPLIRPALDAQFEQSKLIVEQSAIQLQAAKTDLTLRVAQAYFDVIIAQENSLAIEAQKKATFEQLIAANTAFEEGVATVTDKHEAQAKYDLVKANEIYAANEIKIKLSVLRAMIGPFTSATKKLKPQTDDLLPLETKNIEYWSELAEKNAYSVLTQKMALQIANKELLKQNAAFKPTLDLVANIGFNQTKVRNLADSSGVSNVTRNIQSTTNDTSNTSGTSAGNNGIGINSTFNSSANSNTTIDSNSTNNASIQTNTNSSTAISKNQTFEKNASIGIQFAMPLYQGGLFDSKVREAIAQQEKVTADLDLARTNSKLNANKAFLGIVSGLAQVAAYEVAIVSNQMAVNSNKMSYEVGVRLNTDVLNAQQQLYAAQRDLAKARIDVLLFKLQLKAAVGDLNEIDINVANQFLVSSE